MITRESFIAILEAIRKQTLDDERLGRAIDGLVLDNPNHPFIYTTTLNDTLLKILADEMQDKDGYISWWIYDGPDWGRRASEYCISSDLRRIEIHNAGDLYDWLTRS